MYHFLVVHVCLIKFEKVEKHKKWKFTIQNVKI